MSIKILHITPHLGGGVGTVLLNWLTIDKSYLHKIVTLDYANEMSIKICQDNNIELISKIAYSHLIEEIQLADIVVIHFWNHPLLYDFVVKNDIPKARVVIWSHISGAHPPYVFNEKLLDICDKFIFTTPISYSYIRPDEKLDCIFSTGGTEKFFNLINEKHEGYNIGYIGTIDFAKMHPDYPETIMKTNADKIYIVGWGNQDKIFKNCDERFIITGKVSDTSEILKKIDVFAYMLNPKHFGTGEQVLQEAMAAGVVPVVLNNSCETTLVRHNETGLVAKNPDEYIRYINLLKENVSFRKLLAKQAKHYAKENFSLNFLNQRWHAVFEDVIKINKTHKKWHTDKVNLTSYDIFLESLGIYRNLFENKSDKEINKILRTPNWLSETKGTPKQYYSFLGGEELKRLCSLY